MKVTALGLLFAALAVAVAYACPPVMTVFDCLAGPTPPATNMLAAELNETAWKNKRALYRTTMRDSASGSIVVIGDSQIANMDVGLISPHAVNLGISGESSRQILYRINENDINNAPNLIHRAGAVVIETFVNDMGDQATYGSPQNALLTVQGYMLPRLAQWVSGKVVIVAPTMVDTSYGFWTSNPHLATLNASIASIFANRPDVRVVNINPTIAPNGTLLPQYHLDGHHLNDAGKLVKANAIKAALLDLGVTPSALTQ